MHLVKTAGTAAFAVFLILSGCGQSKDVSLSVPSQSAASASSDSSPAPAASATPSGSAAAASASPTPASAVSSSPKPAGVTALQAAVEANAAKCRQEPFAGIGDPSGYELKEKCITVSGSVESVRKDQGGTYHINLKVLKAYKPLLNGKNNTDNKGFLMVDVIPLDQEAIPRPKIGANITVTGAYVLDKQHGWMEIHPAWIVGDKGTADYSTAGAEKTASPTPDNSQQSTTKSAAH